MTKITIDLDNYSKEDQELMQAIWRKFKPVDKKEENHACDAINLLGYDCETIKNNMNKKEWDIKIEDPIWKPERERFYFLQLNHNWMCSYVTTMYSWDSFYKVGYVFKTKEAAQRMADRRKRIGILENKMMEFAEGYAKVFEVDVEKL